MDPKLEPSRPWYREPMVWLVIAIPLSSVLVGGSLAYQAIQAGSQVLPEPVRRVQKYHVADHDRDRRAALVDVHAIARIDPDSGALSLRIEGKTALPPRLRLKLWHATLAAEDQALDLVRAANGEYLGRLQRLPRLPMKLMLEPEDESWLLRGRLPAGATDFELHPIGLERLARG